ncbi:MAG: zf-TFIIB domain-containing protein [Planctomycetes bacterium]|nr:zf-TFIIB domain-containing protein [Planctomycetota bacterium]
MNTAMPQRDNEPRMLLACKTCHRQYDVSAMRRDERVRCRCGELMAVPEAKPRDARLVHCSGCGAPLADGALRCDYCGGVVSAADRGLGPACPECFARLARGARFCTECGVEIRPEAIRTTRATAHCPRCGGCLVLRELPEGHYTECTSCAGIWLDAQSFERAIEHRDAAALGVFVGGDGRPHDVPDQPVRYLSCPVCSRLMNRKNFAGCSGIIIDWCKGHGFWFDTYELEKVIQFVQSGGLDRARTLEIARAKEEIQHLESQKRSIAASPLDIESPPMRRACWHGPLAGVFSFLSDLLD